jgi:hypothetical protein
MSNVWIWSAHALSRSLDPAEREAVFGDFAELGMTDRQALKGMLGLVLRRQLGCWKKWDPWFVLVAIIVPVSPLLARSSNGLAQGVFPSLLMWFRHGVYYETGISLAAFLASLGFRAAALITWSWTSAFVLSALSRRTAWANGALFFVLCVVFGSVPRFIVYSILGFAPWGWLPILVNFLVVLIPAYCGIRLGAKSERITLPWMISLAIWTAIIGGLAFWTQGWYGTVLDNWSRGAPALGLFQLAQRADLWKALVAHLFPAAVLTGPILYLLTMNAFSRKPSRICRG